ncbi:uncharacterized protein LOC111884567 [Lactuca sativa]|uniref:uncharacterized protein LOC111884567 n=1 Tax=Lactuca sativa TaxID=4236 RepID=UPI000CD85115|nr:uncharacterized protein LOC111884567 [Lactuca sativa]
MHIKVNNKWTDSSFDQLLELLHSTFPQDNKVPRSYYLAKKKLKKIGLGYESIPVCKNDCSLFWKEQRSLQICPVCKESQWIVKNTKGKKVAHKVLRYFPMTPRLRRFYCSRYTHKNMIWHSIGRSKYGVMRHPVDGESCQKFDVDYPDFLSEPRNVRSGLAADDFNPFGNMCNPHCTWPVVLTTYNLPPWLCMKELSFILALLIPDPKAHGKDIDVFLKPLVEEIKFLWLSGVLIKDAATDTFFMMKAMSLWTINDFPARSSLSGWSGQWYRACLTCNEETPSYCVVNKVVYIGNLQILDADDQLRMSLKFHGQPETRSSPRNFTNEDMHKQLVRLLLHKRVHHPKTLKENMDQQGFELNWSKRSIFSKLEYWSSLQLKHNFDVMHVEKNVGESLLCTFMINDKSQDTSNAREDFRNMNIQRNQWLQKKGNTFTIPHGSYSFNKPDRKIFCQFIRDVKLPDGFGSNIINKVVDNDTNIIGLKSHDHHILMQRLIPIGVRALLDKETSTPIVDLCMFSRKFAPEH